MRLHLSLKCLQSNAILPINYQYPLSSAIYHIIAHADGAYAGFLHESGYQLDTGKRFKLFCFSALDAPYTLTGDRMILRQRDAGLTIGFQVPKTVETFIAGLFAHQELQIADQQSKAVFAVQQVQMLEPLPGAEAPTLAEALMKPISPLVVGRQNAQGHQDYLSPDDADFLPLLIHNWKEKYAVIAPEVGYPIETMFREVTLTVNQATGGVKSRLITVKAGTTAQTRIRGFVNFRLQVKAPALLLQLALNAGLGLHNALGMGCMSIEQYHFSETPNTTPA